MLIVGAGLMLRSFGALRSEDPGFDPQGVVVFRPAPPSDRYRSAEEVAAYHRQMLEAVESAPGVTSVGGIQFLPMTPGGWWSSYTVPERPLAADQEAQQLAMRAVSPGYFETLGIELLGGRTFDWADGEQENRPVILNRVLADQAWPGEDPIGRTILLTGEDTPFLVVGLVDDVRQQRLATEPVPEAYLPSRMIAWTRLWIAVRGEGEPETLLRSAQAAAWTIDGEVAFTGAGKLEDIVATTIADTRFLAGIMTVFGLLAMGIGAAGVYGMMSHSVAKTFPEIGIRMALGANGASILRRTLVGGLLPVAAGLLVGTMLALAGARLLEGSLYGVQPWDWPTFVLVPVVLLTTAVVACVLPASRAASVDPSLVLGSD